MHFGARWSKKTHISVGFFPSAYLHILQQKRSLSSHEINMPYNYEMLDRTHAPKIINIGPGVLEIFENNTNVQCFETQCSCWRLKLKRALCGYSLWAVTLASIIIDIRQHYGTCSLASTHFSTLRCAVATQTARPSALVTSRPSVFLQKRSVVTSPPAFTSPFLDWRLRRHRQLQLAKHTGANKLGSFTVPVPDRWAIQHSDGLTQIATDAGFDCKMSSFEPL